MNITITYWENILQKVLFLPVTTSFYDVVKVWLKFEDDSMTPFLYMLSHEIEEEEKNIIIVVRVTDFQFFHYGTDSRYIILQA